MSKGSKQRPTDKSKYDSAYDKIFKDPEREAFDAINKRNNHDLKILPHIQAGSVIKPSLTFLETV